jgi:hypothetical protein
LLTGTNGIGKTSILEGLYCLLAQPVPNAAVFPRYQQQIGFQANMPLPNGIPNTPFSFFPVIGYDYYSFWKECSTDRASECQVKAVWGTLNLTWEMKISDFSELDQELKNMASSYGLQSGAGTPYALWEWACVGKAKDDNSSAITQIAHKSKAVQQLGMEPRFSLRIGEITRTACRYVDMSSVRHIPEKISLQTEKLLTDALKIINPNVTGVRHDGVPGRIRVIINDESEYSLGTLGVGAESWVSMLLILSELAGASPKRGMPVMFLVDEIGAGIHYSKLEEMWGFLLKFLSQYPQIQMVLTTHNHDCINAFCNTFQNERSGMAKIVRLHKFDAKDGVKITEYTQEMFSSILSGEWEVRG